MGFFRFFPWLLVALAGQAVAVGLGDLRGQPALGERPEFEIDIHGGGKEVLDPACFRLRQPADGDLPWLTKAAFSVRKGPQPVLQIHGDSILREPILQLAVHLACGHDVVREYTVLVSPAKENLPVEQPAGTALVPPEVASARPRPPRPIATPSADRPGAERLAPLPMPERRHPQKMLPDRLRLVGDGDVGEPSLRLAMALLSWGRVAEVGEAQREILRLEFRMLLALQDQATTQLAAAEKLRNMEETLGELQKRSAEFAQQLEKDVVPPPVDNPQAKPAEALTPPLPPVVVPLARPTVPADRATALSEWSLYGLVLGALLGIGTWLGWRHYRDRRQRLDDAACLVPEVAVDATRAEEGAGFAEVDLPMEPVAKGMPMQVDVHLDVDEAFQPVAGNAPLPNVDALPTEDSLQSISAATVDEHFEANPVMELADIMLSFGRVKGAAQALQEFIDNNPEEAVQPWIRLMEIYRMAGMREEFDAVARSLNQYFNVEIQQWEVGPTTADGHAIDLILGEQAVAPMVSPLGEERPESLEKMPRLMQQIVGLWSAGDVVAYLHQLLRDNRGGKRAGFALPVVEEILFLIELKEIINKTAGGTGHHE